MGMQAPRRDKGGAEGAGPVPAETPPTRAAPPLDALIAILARAAKREPRPNPNADPSG